MNEGYSPTSDFLCMVANDEVPLTGSDAADQNLRLLIKFTRDTDVSNRDWATFLLAQQELDTPEVKQALFEAVKDTNVDVRAEALQGLAKRDPSLARPLIELELSKNECGYGTFEAAELVAHRSLLNPLQKWRGMFPDSWWNEIVEAAISACRSADRTES